MDLYVLVTVVWTAGHHGIPGNEEADKLAREGSNGVPSDQTVGNPFVVAKEVVMSNWRQEHLQRFTLVHDCNVQTTVK